jgi:hypothetical protein
MNGKCHIAKLDIHANYKILTQPAELERKIYVFTLAKTPFNISEACSIQPSPYEQQKSG